MQSCRSCLVWGFLNSPYGLGSAGRAVATDTFSAPRKKPATVPSKARRSARTGPRSFSETIPSRVKDGLPQVLEIRDLSSKAYFFW